VELYPALLSIAKLLLSEDGEKTPELLFRKVLEATGADRGFIVVREGDSFEQRFDVGFDRAEAPPGDRRFSRTVVRRAIKDQRLIHSPNPPADARFATKESIEAMGAGAVLVAPLAHAGEVHGVIYLQHEAPGRDFSPEAIRLVEEFAELAGLFLRRAIEREALTRRNRSLERDLFAQHDFQGIVGRHPAMLALLRQVAQVADTSATILVHGETGTGKELIARALHVNSARRDRPFVTLHTTALPGSVLESELFGHVRGAFTGADRDRPGRIASAHGGTLFLDEVAEISPEVQAKLLRFLQFGEVQRLGSDKVERVNVRVVSATHRELPAMVAAGKFRQDLYYRLNVIDLTIPPLRERASDVPLLVEHYLEQHGKRLGGRPRFTPAAQRALELHDFPGNVRELAHLVERACALATGPELDVDLLPAGVRARSPEPPRAASGAANAALPAPIEPPAGLTAEGLAAARDGAADAAERAFLKALMERHGGNVSQAARESGIRRSYLQKLLARHKGGGV
jgi:Nif-specific regulatory protein/two-component system response regulator HydG